MYFRNKKSMRHPMLLVEIISSLQDHIQRSCTKGYEWTCKMMEQFRESNKRSELPLKPSAYQTA